MDLPLWLQYVLVALLVAASAVVVVSKQFPRVALSLRRRAALWLLRAGRPSLLRSIGRRIAPAATATTAGCDGCSSCD